MQMNKKKICVAIALGWHWVLLWGKKTEDTTSDNRVSVHKDFVRITQHRLLLSKLKAMFFNLLILQMPHSKEKTANVTGHSVGIT